MKRRIAVLLLFVLIAVGLYAADARERLAGQAAEQWLALIDAGKYPESWQDTSTYMQKAVAKKRWQEILTATRKPLGTLEKRKLKSAKYQTTLPGAPDGQYVVLVFDTSFQNKKEAVETVTMQLELDGAWKPSGYFIR
jgi:menaquinone-dependent protoporphyrinogen IX oxidase